MPFSPSRDVISETESDNQQRQIHQEAHRVFRSRRHISEDLENEHLEPRDLDNVSGEERWPPPLLSEEQHLTRTSTEAPLVRRSNGPLLSPVAAVQSWELITEEDPNDSMAQSLPGPSSILTPPPPPPPQTPVTQEFSDDLNLRLSLTPDANGEVPGPSSALVRLRANSRLPFLIFFPCDQT